MNTNPVPDLIFEVSDTVFITGKKEDITRGLYYLAEGIVP